MNRRCEKCSSVLGDQADMCVVCGSLPEPPGTPGKSVECENHQDEKAIGCCVVCGKPVCGDCSTSRNEKLFCDEPEHELLLEEREVLAVTGSKSEAAMIEVNLKQQGFDPRVFPRDDHVAVFWFPRLRCFRILLPKEEVKKGKEVLSSLGLVEPPGNSVKESVQ